MLLIGRSFPCVSEQQNYARCSVQTMLRGGLSKAVDGFVADIAICKQEPYIAPLKVFKILPIGIQARWIGSSTGLKIVESRQASWHQKWGLCDGIPRKNNSRPAILCSK
jgi:hypothetical protein